MIQENGEMWFLLGFVLLVLIEIVLLIQMGSMIGLWLTLGWIILTGGLGIVLLKGIATIGGVQNYRLDEFEDRNSPVAHRALVLLAGVFLVLPGVLTDLLGLLLLFAPVRRAIVGLIGRRVRDMSGESAVQVVIDGEWQDVSGSTGPGKRNSDGS